MGWGRETKQLTSGKEERERGKMPGLIAVSEFVEETREDYNSPTTSTFVSRMPQCRQTITSLEEVSTTTIHAVAIMTVVSRKPTVRHNL